MHKNLQRLQNLIPRIHIPLTTFKAISSQYKRAKKNRSLCVSITLFPFALHSHQKRSLKNQK